MIGCCRVALSIVLWFAIAATAGAQSQSATAPAAAQSQSATTPPPSAADEAALQATISHLEQARQHYTNRRLTDAERELSATIDGVQSAREADRARPVAVRGEQLPRAGRDVPFPALLKREAPVYPLEAAQQGIRGHVIVDAVIGKNGKIRDARVARSIPALDRASLDAVRRWRFAPSIVNGAPTDVATTLVMAFTFRRESLPSDDFDLAQFYTERRQFADAEVALVRARAAVTEEVTCFDQSSPIGFGVGANIGRIEPPRKVKDVKPKYPPLAQKARIMGAVVMEASIAVDGRVKCARVIKSIPLLDQEAIDTVSQWEFAPMLKNGTPMPVRMTVTVNFSLR
jgi:TonB family protein